MSSPELITFGKQVLAARTAKGWTGAQLAHEALGNQDRKGFISQVEKGKRPLSALTIQKFGKALDLPEAVINPLLGLDLPADDTPPDTLPSSEKLEDVASLTLDQLKFLAEQFEIEAAEGMTQPQLQHLLTQKAEEYRSYRDQIDALDDRISAVHNLKGAAQEAADRLDFDAVEDFLARVDAVETEIMAETKEARAANALLRGRADDAYAIYTAAAESFRQLNVTEMAWRRDTYRSKLYNHGLRYGGTGLPRAIDMIRPAIDALKDTTHKIDWAAYTQNLAIALEAQGTRTDGPAGTALLAEAVTAYRDALTISTKADHPVQWAMTIENIAETEEAIADHAATDDPRPHLESALAHVDAALEVFDPDHMSFDHATATKLHTRILAKLNAL